VFHAGWKPVRTGEFAGTHLDRVVLASCRESGFYGLSKPGRHREFSGALSYEGCLPDTKLP
jgi:hypothetical protein